MQRKVGARRGSCLLWRHKIRSRIGLVYIENCCEINLVQEKFLDNMKFIDCFFVVDKDKIY